MKVLNTIAIIFFFLFICFSNGYCQFMKVVSTVPVNNQKDVPLDQVIVIRFKQPLRKNIANPDLIFEVQSKTPVKSTLSFSDDKRTIFVTPNEPLKRNTYYMVNITTLVSDMELRDFYTKDVHFTTIGGNFRCIAYSTPAEITLPPGGFKDVLYKFTETGGGIGEIKRCKLSYETLNGQEISNSMNEMKLFIKDKETVTLPASISIPIELGNRLKGSTIYIRRIFEGVDGDNNYFTIRTGIKTTIADNINVSNNNWKATVTSPEYGAVVPKGSIISVESVLNGVPNSQVHGCWVVNGTPTGFFAANTDVNGRLKQSFSDKFLAANSGTYSVALQIISPVKMTCEPIEYIVSASPVNSPILMYPKPSQIFKKNSSNTPSFKWASTLGAISYKFAISKKREDASKVWVDCTTNSYTPTWVKWSELETGTFYWFVKPVFPDGKVGNEAPPSMFMIND